MMTDEHKDYVQRLLYRYKYENRPLERTVKDCFALADISDTCLNNKDHIALIKTLTLELVDYKFNQSDMSRLELVDFIEKWMKENVDTLNGTRYSVSEVFNF